MRRMPQHRDEWLVILIFCAITLAISRFFIPKYTYTDPQKRYALPAGIPRYSDNPDH